MLLPKSSIGYCLPPVYALVIGKSDLKAKAGCLPVCLLLQHIVKVKHSHRCPTVPSE